MHSMTIPNNELPKSERPMWSAVFVVIAAGGQP
jgi:hypothetical protein